MRYINELLLVILYIIPRYFWIEKTKITIFIHMLSIMLSVTKGNSIDFPLWYSAMYNVPLWYGLKVIKNMNRGVNILDLGGFELQNVFQG